ncbi:MAG: hypothetical protein ACR2N4_04810 [Jatrophihabitans sp.]
MDPVLINLIVSHSMLVLTAVAAFGYLHHVQIERPPIGVFNLRDVGFTVVVLSVIPLLYLHLPRWLLASVLTSLGFALTIQALAPLVGRPIRIATAVALCGTEVGLVISGHAGTPVFHAVNDLALLILAVGICNSWAQSGLRARDVAIFAVVVAGYDLVSTGLLSTTVELARRLSGLPFVPWLGWGTGSDAAFTGLGDLLFITLWPLVAAKAYSAAAGRAAMVVTMGCIAVTTTLTLAGLLTGAIPTMVLVGPAIAAHWWWLHRRHPKERTAGEFEAARHPGLPSEPRYERPDADLAAALALLAGPPPSSAYHAVHGGVVIASGDDAAAVMDAAGRREPTAVPVLVFTHG